ncbi:MAG: hypothetical protein R2825_06665 [Saprospiraceae bacterium]
MSCSEINHGNAVVVAVADENIFIAGYQRVWAGPADGWNSLY